MFGLLFVLQIKKNKYTDKKVVILYAYLCIGPKGAEELLLKHEDGKLVLTIVSVENLHIQ
jgi:hypothetical protein